MCTFNEAHIRKNVYKFKLLGALSPRIFITFDIQRKML